MTWKVHKIKRTKSKLKPGIFPLIFISRLVYKKFLGIRDLRGRSDLGGFDLSLYRDRFCQVARLIYIQATLSSNMICQKL